MPFINDMLQETERRRRDEQALQTENRSTDPVVEAHLAARGIESRYQFDIDSIARHLHGGIIGQDDAVEAVVNMLRIVRADIADPRKPLYTSLLLGPTGVGKTELVRVLARAIHGDADALCKANASKFITP